MDTTITFCCKIKAAFIKDIVDDSKSSVNAISECNLMESGH